MILEIAFMEVLPDSHLKFETAVKGGSLRNLVQVERLHRFRNAQGN